MEAAALLALAEALLALAEALASLEAALEALAEAALEDELELPQPASIAPAPAMAATAAPPATNERLETFEFSIDILVLPFPYRPAIPPSV